MLLATLSKLRNSIESTCGMEGNLPRLISCHFSPLVGKGSAPEALTIVRARAKMSAFVKLLYSYRETQSRCKHGPPRK